MRNESAAFANERADGVGVNAAPLPPHAGAQRPPVPRLVSRARECVCVCVRVRVRVRVGVVVRVRERERKEGQRRRR